MVHTNASCTVYWKLFNAMHEVLLAYPFVHPAQTSRKIGSGTRASQQGHCEEEHGLTKNLNLLRTVDHFITTLLVFILLLSGSGSSDGGFCNDHAVASAGGGSYDNDYAS